MAQRLCEHLAAHAAIHFADVTGTTWAAVATLLIEQVRASGHDLIRVDDGDAEGFQRWQADWYHPRGNFSLLLGFRAPKDVEVSWRTDDATFTAQR